MWESYYRDLNDVNNNFRNEAVPLQLNCTGRQTFSQQYTAASQRKDYYLFYLFKGEVHVHSPVNGRTELGSGDLIVFEKDLPFAYSSPPECSTTHYFAHFTGSYAAGLLRDCRIPLNTVCTVGMSEQITMAFERLFSPFIRRDEFFDPDCSARLTDLLVLIGRMQSGQNNAESVKSTEKLRNSLEYLQTNFTPPVTIAQLAAMDFLSESRYRTLFREILHQSPQDYLIRLRLNMACSLLRSTDLPIAQIAQASGYADQRYFARLFRDRLGCSPGEYRKM